MKHFRNGRFTAILGSIAAGITLLLQISKADR